MFSEKDQSELEKDIKHQIDNDDDDIQIDMSNEAKIKGSLGKNYSSKFKNLQIKYKKDKKKILVVLAGILTMISALCGSSYAYLTYVSKTENSVTINAGTLALVFQNEENVISLTNAVPVKDSVGLQSDKEYSFDVKNTGTLPAKYTITLDDICTTGNGVDVCMPDEYIKVGIKVGNKAYKVVERNDKNEYVIETGSLDANEVQSYKMKIWLAHRTPNTYNGADDKNVYYKGKLGLTYEQGTEYKLEPGATVLYSDGTLIINEPTTKREANIQTHGAVSKEYPDMKMEGTDIEKYIFASTSQRPWDSDANSITSVEIGQKIRPSDTKYWFSSCQNMTEGDLTNLDTRNVTEMSSMFYKAGNNSGVAVFTLTGLDSWDTSKVTNMSGMFRSAGYNATTFNIGNLSNWDTSKVMNMSQMFYQAGYNATTWNIGDLSNWDTSKVTNMSTMFYNAGSRATTWNSIGTLKVYATNIARMFYSCGKAKATLNIYSNPTSYDSAFSGATDSSALITVNYSSATTNIDNIIATKTSNSNVVKGSQLD